MDAGNGKELWKIAYELRGIRKSLEFIAMLEAYREGIPFADDVTAKEEVKEKQKDKPHRRESEIQYMIDNRGFE